MTDPDDARQQLLVLAAGVLCRRHALGYYTELSAAQVDELAALLIGPADPGDAPRAPRAEAIALAHRLIDDDAPQTSPLWPRGGTRHDDAHPQGPADLDRDGHHPDPVLTGRR